MDYPCPPCPPPDPNANHKLEAISVCIGYGDFLQETVKNNISLFDRWVIVTSEQDTETREICRQYGLQVFLTEDHHRHGHTFNKGRVIERALHQLDAQGWRLHLDVDMALPARFRHFLFSAELDPTCLYGVDRAMCKSYEDWRKVQTSGYLQHAQTCYVKFPPGLGVGARWATETTGWCPVGAFQLWHSDADYWRGTRIRQYPDRHNSASRGDIQFSLLWDRQKRILLPEIVAVHLESAGSKHAANWNGRTTPRFGPPRKYF